MHALVKRSFLVLGMIGVLFLLSSRVLFFKKSWVELCAARLITPFIAVSSFVATQVRAVGEHIDDYRSLRAKHSQLQGDYLWLLDELIKERAVSRAYDHIKPIVDFEQRYSYDKALTAKILVKNLTPEEHYFLVNQGLRDGVRKDMVAFYHNHLLGRVVEVYNFYSKVQLITDQHCKVAAYTTTTRAVGIVQGFNCVNRCNVLYVSHLMKINDGDMVISSGQGLVFPEGFCLGKIVTHVLQEKALYHEIQIEPMIAIESLRYCCIADAGEAKML